MKRLLLILLLATAALVAPNIAHAACGLPEAKPLWVDYGTPELLAHFGRPGIVVAGAGKDYPAKARSLGAKTVYWDMYLNTRVGTPSAPAHQDLLPARAQRVFDFAVLSAGCPDPVIAMNELFGASVPTPWTPTTGRYRANVLEWARLLRAKGGHPVLLVSSEPYTGGEAGQWWRELAQVADIALEKYFNAPAVHRGGAGAWQPPHADVDARLVRQALCGRGAVREAGRRPRLSDEARCGRARRPRARRRLVRGREAAGARRAASRTRARARPYLVVGLGFLQRGGEGSRQAGAACVWLWARDPSLCAAEKLPERFDRDLRVGQVDLPTGVRCALGNATIRTNEIAGLARVTGDAELALTALYARLVQQRVASAGPGRVRAAERVIVLRRFGGSRAPYLAALARTRASSAVALGAIADEVRREAIQARLPAPAPAATEIAEFAATYAGTQLRDIPGAGAVPGVTPETPLGLLSEALARPVIVRALRHAARAGTYDAWSEKRQHAALAELRCTRDRLPSVGTVRVTSWLPFLVPLAAGS